MSTIEFQAIVKNGVIEIPEAYRFDLSEGAEVTVVSQKKTAKIGMIAELIENPLMVENLNFLTREEANDQNVLRRHARWSIR
jgi:hypothetical protein